MTIPSHDGSATTEHPPLTALDLALLAARLDPDQCKTNPEAAFFNAVAFYNMAAWFVEQNQELDFAKLVASIDSNIARADLRLVELATERAFRFWEEPNR